MHRRRTFVLVVLMALPGILFGQARSAPLPSSLVTAVKAAYQREFGEVIEYPAIYDNPQPIDCRGNRHPPITTTAYLRKGALTTLLTMYLSQDGVVEHTTRSEVPAAPAGTFRVLCLLVRYPETFTADALRLWEDAQRQINEEHAALARSRGYKGSIIVFNNTNMVIDPNEIGNPHSPDSARAAARNRGVSPADYRIIMTIDVNPRESAGGLSLGAERSVYVGNYGAWKTPLDSKNWKRVAATAYHHEMAHQWGWTHDWVVSCAGTPEYAPFIAPPVLFGWEDLHGDHVPEILRETPDNPR